MTDLERTLWNDEEIQQFLDLLICEHQRRLLDLNSPRGDQYAKEFIQRIEPVITGSDVLDGAAIYQILIQTGGTDYARDLYGRCKDKGLSDLLLRKSTLPPLLDVADELAAMPDLKPELIGGILRRGHSMLIAGGSKTSKSFLALELAVSLATGRDWLGVYPCKQGRVLYVDGEIDRASCDRRIAAILERMKISREDLRGKMSVVSLRGVDMSIGQLTEQIRQNGGYDLIVLDPLYTLGDVSDENNAAAVREFLRGIGRLSTETGAAAVCIHHHSKGQQATKRAIDRASGSGVFGRWFDAVIDLSALHAPYGTAEQSRTSESVPMRLEFDVRDFAQPKPLSLWWSYPVHVPDVSGDLDGLFVDGDPRANLAQYRDGVSSGQKQIQHDDEISGAISAIVADGREPTIKAVADELAVSDRAIRKWIENSSAIVKDGKILKTERR